MLLQLHVKNLAIIDEVEVDFTEGLNILTGETGAGKSVILGSIHLALGAKADKDSIRDGAEYALVELVFQVENEEQKKKIEALDLPVEEDGVVILQRKISPARSVFKVCGETVSASVLKELAPILLDIYGQHDYQSLLQDKKHLDILDSFGDKTLAEQKALLKEEYAKYLDLKKAYDTPEMSPEQRERELSFARFEVDEIEKAKLVPGELEELESNLRKMENSGKVKEGLVRVLQLLKEEDSSCENSLNRALREMSHLSSLDDDMAELEERMTEVDSLLRDLSRDLNFALEADDFDEREFVRVRERVDLINHLQIKYGKSIEQILNYAEERKAYIYRLENAVEESERIGKELADKEALLEEYAKALRKLRQAEAVKLEKEIVEALHDLNFMQAEFEVSFEEAEQVGANGKDKVVFMISTNPGEKLRPLSAVASGGELSRIMLAIKTISAKRDDINTLIFDEIDSGISGKTAWKVSEKLGTLAKSHQVICITHLPQIAAMADSHYCIEKSEQNGKTVTNIMPLNEDGALNEVARLLGGEVITDAVLENARELKI
ncbi:MAG: DNA repair protein RecN, partial [Lachnospiraceae bacterium]|nr:DNA repair protein RecN [Lachnospiraceae bacterium]